MIDSSFHLCTCKIIDGSLYELSIILQVNFTAKQQPIKLKIIATATTVDFNYFWRDYYLLTYLILV